MTIPNPTRATEPTSNVVALRRKPKSTNRGKRFPAHPWDIEDLVRLLDECRPLVPGRYGHLSAMRLYALVILLWRTGLRISEALALEGPDLSPVHRTVVVRCGKGGKRRTVVMDAWAWQQITPWLEARNSLPYGPVFCVIRGQTAGTEWQSTDVRRQLKQAGERAGLRRRTAPHQLRHTHAVELWREKMDVYTIQTQLGHARLDVTALYLRGVGATEVLQPIAERRQPMMPVLAPGRRR